MLDLESGRAGAYRDAAITRQLDHMRQVAEGERDHALYFSAVVLGQFAADGALSINQAATLLEETTPSTGLTRFVTLRTIRSGSPPAHGVPEVAA